MSTWLSKLAECLVVLVLVAVAARAIWTLLGPLVPPLLLLLIVGGLVLVILRGPRSGG
jgi:NhaP-type Na+/H+ or K+/H+ antiporter